MNSVNLIGKLCFDPELKFSAAGTAVVKIKIAIDRRFKKQDGNKETDFISCIAFGPRAELIANYFTKGRTIGIEGRVQTGSYKDKEGKTVYTTDVIVEEITFCEKSNKSGQEQKNGFNDDITPIEDSSDIPF